jgi:hypothetical protein
MKVIAIKPQLAYEFTDETESIKFDLSRENTLVL